MLARRLCAIPFLLAAVYGFLRIHSTRSVLHVYKRKLETREIFTARRSPVNFTDIIARTYRPMVKAAREPNASELLKTFRPYHNESSLYRYRELAMLFDAAARRANVSYFICFGTLLGSYRHHGLIPWDTDIDFCVDVRDLPTTKAALQYQMGIGVFAGDYILEQSSENFFRLFKYKIPFHVDIFFYEVEQPSGRMLLFKPYKSYYVCNVSHVLPVARRPFWDLMLSAPRDSLACLSTNFNLSSCVTQAPQFNITDCKHLQNLYPFVVRHTIGSGINETLRLGGDVYGWFTYRI